MNKCKICGVVRQRKLLGDDFIDNANKDMKKCSKTITGRHLWSYPSQEDLLPKEETYIDENDIIQVIPRRCVACGIIDDTVIPLQ